MVDRSEDRGVQEAGEADTVRQEPLASDPSRSHRSPQESLLDQLIDQAIDEVVAQSLDDSGEMLLDDSGDQGDQGREDQEKGESDGGEEDALRSLQEILFRDDRARVDTLAQRIDALQRQLNDKDALAAAIAPVLGEAIRTQIREAREEIVDALYPIIGRIVVKAVAEAIRDLARAIDERVRTSFDLHTVWRRVKSFLTGVPEGELALREALPFVIQEIYLIHRESGLLLWYAGREPDRSLNADLIGAMLTAIRDFVGHVLGGDQEQHLNELQYGECQILLEFARHSYVGVVVDGIPPAGFRSELRQRLFAFDNAVRAVLVAYNGEAGAVAGPAEEIFATMLQR